MCWKEHLIHCFHVRVCVKERMWMMVLRASTETSTSTSHFHLGNAQQKSGNCVIMMFSNIMRSDLFWFHWRRNLSMPKIGECVSITSIQCVNINMTTTLVAIPIVSFSQWQRKTRTFSLFYFFNKTFYHVLLSLILLLHPLRSLRQTSCTHTHYKTVIRSWNPNNKKKLSSPVLSGNDDII